VGVLSTQLLHKQFVQERSEASEPGDFAVVSVSHEHKALAPA